MQRGARGSPPGGVVALHAGPDRPDEQFGRRRPQAVPQVPGQHLGVTGRGEQCRPSHVQFTGQLCALSGMGNDLAEGPEDSAPASRRRTRM